MTGPNVSKPGVPWLRWVAVLIPPALLLAFPPSGLTAKQDHLLAVFVATIVALVAQPVPMGVSCVVAMTVLALTRTVPPVQVLSDRKARSSAGGIRGHHRRVGSAAGADGRQLRGGHDRAGIDPHGAASASAFRSESKVICWRYSWPPSSRW